MSFPNSNQESQPLLDALEAENSYNSVAVASPSKDSPPLNNVSHADFIWIMSGIYSTVLLAAIDGTLVATLASPIGSYFKKVEQASYLGTTYLLAVCCFTPIYGRLSDILGRKGAMLIALTLFGSGTIACGLAPSMETLILARTIAGIGGGGIMTVSSVAISDFVPLKKRSLYQGISSVLLGLGGGLGGPIGGWINDTWGWRAAFLLQAPFLIMCFVLILLKLNVKLPDAVANESIHSKLGRIDFLGSFTMVVSIASMLSAFSIKTTEELPWSHPLIWGLLTSGCIFGVAFIWVETRWARYPVMPLRLMLQRTSLAVSLSILLAEITSFSMIFNIPLYFSAVKLNSATDAGFHLLPYSVALPIAGVFTGWLISRTGKFFKIILVSTALPILADVLVASWNDNTSSLHLWLDIVPQGLARGSLINSTFMAMIASVSRDDMAVATGSMFLFRIMGQVLGVSLSGILLQGVLVDQLRKRITGPGSFDVINEIRHSISLIPELAPALRNAAVESYATALRVVFIGQVATSVLALVACAFIEEHPLS